MVPDEHLSPELVLVAPELREHALVGLEDPPWRVTPARIIPLGRPAASTRAGAVREVLVAFFAFPIVAFVVATLATLLLTVAANASR
jgi:membrane protein DedA with SNARE-associated domain